MKYGLLTYHSSHNYGAMLQAYGLQKKLMELGGDAEFINFHPEQRELKNKRKIRVKSLGSLVQMLAMTLFRSKLDKRYANFEKFRKDYLREGKRYRNYEELVARPPEVDAYICGSDQIWNVEQGLSEVFFLRGFSGGKPAFAYAGSFGTEDIPESIREKLVEWLKVYTKITVREDRGLGFLREQGFHEAKQVVDPIFLLPVEEWEKLIIPPRIPESQKYVLFYSLESSPLASAVIEKIHRSTGYRVVVVGKPGPFMLKCRSLIAIDAGPRELLGWIRNASLVVANSFHGVAFAAHFEVPFVAIKHTKRNVRVESLLRLLNAEDRAVANDGDVERLCESGLFEVADKTSGRLLEMSRESESFLRDLIADGNQSREVAGTED